MEASPGSDMMQESINRTKSFYSSMHSKLQQAEPGCNPEMLQAQHNEAVRAGRSPSKRSPSRNNYDAINSLPQLPGSLKGTGAHANPEGWSNSLGGSPLGNNRAQVLWGRSKDISPSADKKFMDLYISDKQQRSGVKESLEELDECLTAELFLADCPSAGPSERRVLVHASMWEKFMDKFKMYRPLLSRIKGEYDLVLHQYSQQLHMLNATQFKVASESLSKSEEFLEMKNKCFDEIAMLRNKLDGMTKEQNTKGKSIESIQEQVEHWKSQAATRVPMVKLQMAEAEAAELMQQLTREQQAHDKTRAELDRVTEKLNQNSTELDQTQNQMMDMTPRPDWSDIASNVPDLADGFKKCATSAQRMDQMEGLLKKSCDAVKKIQKKKGGGKKGAAKEGAFDYFTGLGTAKDVPEFLKTNGRVRNSHLAKGACEDLVKECWDMKAKADEGQKKPCKLGAFFPTFLTTKFGKDFVTENAYNMWFSLRDYSWDADCDLFLRILQGKMDEEVYIDQMKLLNDMLQKFKDTDLALHGDTPTKKIPKDVLKTVFSEFFSVKTDKDIKDCFKQLDKEYLTEEIEYDLIFAEDEEGNQGDFIECVRDQHLADREDYIESIEEALWDQDEDDTGEITVGHVKIAFTTFDADKPPEEVMEVVARVLGKPVKQLKDATVIAIPSFLKTVQQMSVHRRTKKV